MLKTYRPFTAVRFLLGAFFCALPIMTYAATQTTTFQVTLTVTSSCTISATNLNFGATSLLTTAIDAQSTITVSCSNTVPYSITLDAGSVAGSTLGVRKLLGPAPTALIDYQIYKDTTRTLPWGDGVTLSTLTYSDVGTGTPQTINVYGRTAVNATAPAPGVYTSTVTATITY